MSLAKRLSAVMTQRGITRTQLSEAVGRSRQSVAYWLEGRNEPAADVLSKIAEYLHVSPLWLKTGEDVVTTEPIAVSEDVASRNDYVFIPEYRLEFGCAPSGRDAPSWTPEPEDKAAYRLSFFQSRGIKPEQCKRVVAEGDSMEPFICDGDKVLFVEQAPGAPIRDGKVYALSYGGALKIKRLYRKANGDLIISSDNPKYPDEVIPNAEIDDLVRIYGRVIERSGSI